MWANAPGSAAGALGPASVSGQSGVAHPAGQGGRKPRGGPNGQAASAALWGPLELGDQMFTLVKRDAIAQGGGCLD